MSLIGLHYPQFNDFSRNDFFFENVLDTYVYQLRYTNTFRWVYLYRKDADGEKNFNSSDICI